MLFQTYLNAIFGQFMRVSCADNLVSFDTCICNLGCNIPVTDTYNQTILWSIVLIFILENQSLASLIISFSFTTPLEPNLVALEVLLVLYNFNEPLENEKKNFKHVQLINVSCANVGSSITPYNKNLKLARKNHKILYSSFILESSLGFDLLI